MNNCQNPFQAIIRLKKIIPGRYIFYIELVGDVRFCDAIDIMGVKWVFRYLGNIKVTPNIISLI